MLGNEAIARGAYEAGVTIVSSYPGTPSTEITEFISGYDEIYSEWAVNEKVALEVVIGSSVGGARSLTAMKHVGLNVAADPLFSSSYAGVNGGLVIVVADEPGMHSSQNEQNTRLLAQASKIPVLEPSDSQECKDFVIEAFDISEKFDTPIIIRLTTRVSHSRSLVNLGVRKDVPKKTYKKDMSKYCLMPAYARKKRLVIEQRIRMMEEYGSGAEINTLEMDSEKIGIITSGFSYQYVKEALGDKASILKLGMIYPFPKNKIIDFANKFEELYVVEELEPFIETFLHEQNIKVKGKKYFPEIGELSSKIVKDVVLGTNATEDYTPEKESIDMPVRPPVLCIGCPHRGVFHSLNKLKLNVFGDIGCYTLGALEPTNSVHTCICMGAGITMIHGFNKQNDEGVKSVAVIGDSTFFHSGITGLINIVYNQSSSTVIILDNSITGMTGHQHNPSTGYNIKSEIAPIINIENIVKAIGVKFVKTVDPINIEEFEAVVKEAVNLDEPSVIIAKRPCVLLKESNTNVKYTIDSDKCINCGMCVKSGCPALSKGEHAVSIMLDHCRGCGLCKNICKFSAIEKAGENHG